MTWRLLVLACDVLCYCRRLAMKECVMSDFGCPACGSPAFVYPRALKDDKPVTCASCGAFVSTYGELKQHSERAVLSHPNRVPVSGC
jgi:uncharacterized Zn finger protein (UPF0148 family)